MVGGFNLVMFFGMIFMPESPIWLLANNQNDEAKRSLQRLRGKSVTLIYQNKTITSALTTYNCLLQANEYRGRIPAHERQSTEECSTKLQHPTIRVSQRLCLETSGHIDGSHVLPAVHRNQRHGVLHN